MTQANDNLKNIVAEFAAIQNDLLGALHVLAQGSLSIPNPQTWPQRGLVEARGSQWQFNRHGMGYLFVETSGGRVIEAHEHVVHPPYPIDAYRLREFLLSLATSHVTVGGKSFDATLNDLQRALATLADAGDLRVDPSVRQGSTPRYFFPSSSNIP